MPVIGRHKASQNADSSATHNLEVPGSSPGWSTTTNQQLTSNRKLLIFYAINLLYHNFAVVENVYALLCRLVLQVLTVQSKVFFI